MHKIRSTHRINLFILILMICGFSCATDKEEKAENEQKKPESEYAFDKGKWKLKEGEAYPYREKMLNDVVYNDTIRSLSRDELTSLLGAPDRINENHHYYTISQKRIGIWTIHKKSMVVKFRKNDTIEWIKIHE